MKNRSEKWLQSPYLCEVKLTYQPDIQVSLQPVLVSPEEAFCYLKEIWEMDTIELHEEFYVLLFDNSIRCLGWSKISMGGKSSTIVDVSKIVSIALLGNACSVILAHNHPSGLLKPSTADINLTQRISKALSLLGIKLSDHLIICRNGYYSFSEHNLLSRS